LVGAVALEEPEGFEALPGVAALDEALLAPLSLPDFDPLIGPVFFELSPPGCSLPVVAVLSKLPVLPADPMLPEPGVPEVAAPAVPSPWLLPALPEVPPPLELVPMPAPEAP
jgi:hypothetical protein